MIYLVRHGQSTWNVQRRTQGQLSHPPLTARGRRQVAAAGAAITADLQAAGRRVDVFVSSDLLRTRQTAAILAAGRPVVLDRRLREQHLGRLQGMADDAAAAATEGVDWTDPDVAIGGGESARQVHDRMAAVVTAYRDRVAVLVSHGDAVRHAVGWWDGHEPARGPWVTVRSAAVFVLADPGRHRELVIAGTAPPA
ncbi:probable phosphoglycerate mutase [Jatrophihabitans endophyticus]|uniref:Probable phosphoglycerate mutase n=1 Tax=Jatrophihabitans endophyticus TaxID=1206085 RepID=A0A1M5Q7Y5_9ACTN|nr:histidine phosphatase family protein [Jatrophihabitans endophyticus]SHH10040.1 probable phosphoglycerate mutase [Jatrophihabitans endophyticus]